ncbi:FliH/SctL family protein [Novosphingobium rosa]|uniref:FliH/SctL family protein n=1 Tax=Novosphingobium rosa TaxID=76978 RepID=UPI00083112C2|nr:FliH/SctL family protein [Novosphingobium rosa]
MSKAPIAKAAAKPASPKPAAAKPAAAKKAAAAAPEPERRADLASLFARPGGGFSLDQRYIANPVETTAPTGSGLAYSDLRPTRVIDPALPSMPSLPEAPPVDPVAQAREEAHAQGYAEGHAEAEHDFLQREALRARFAFSFDRIDGQCAEQLRNRLMDTVMALCEATLAPLALDKEALAARVKRAVAMFARADDERVIRLNAEDLELVREHLPEDWTFVVDPALEPGALRVETSSRGMEGGGVEDGPAQWRRAIAEALDLTLPEND